MARAADDRAWDHTSRLWEALVNQWRGKDTSPVPWTAIHPYHADQGGGQGGRLRLTRDNIAAYAEAIQENAQRKRH